jgi:hypothetical protein
MVGAAAVTEYEEDRIYCLRCNEQPDHFLERNPEEWMPVNPDGSSLDQRTLEDLEYQCPSCNGPAYWGSLIPENIGSGADSGR